MTVEEPEARVQRYLYQYIPLSAAMGVQVRTASAEFVKLAAPLRPNVNHTETVFGGSAAALATLSAWTLLHLRLENAGLDARLVIQRSRMEYEKPIPAAPMLQLTAMVHTGTEGDSAAATPMIPTVMHAKPSRTNTRGPHRCT